MRKVLFAVVVAGLASSASSAVAQQPARKKAPEKFVLRKDALGASATGDAARARARKGDCPGALEGFDAAIRVSNDPTLRRDRGLCHEQLNDPFPAIDDYRAYLTASPDATDAEDIRERLGRLESQMGLGGPAERRTDASGNVRLVVGKDDGYDSSRAEDDDDTGPLRRGSGWVLGPYAGIRKWFNSSGFSNSSWAETVGFRLGYSFNRTSSLFAEAGFERFNSTEANAVTLSGLSTQIAYEARLPVTRRHVDDYFLLGFGFAYEQLFLGGSNTSLVASTSFAGFGGRGRFGWRHNLGAKAAFEVALDGGVARFVGSGGDGATGIFTGLNIALVFGINPNR